LLHQKKNRAGEVAETKGGALENLVSDRRSTALTLLSLGGFQRRGGVFCPVFLEVFFGEEIPNNHLGWLKPYK